MLFSPPKGLEDPTHNLTNSARVSASTPVIYAEGHIPGAVVRSSPKRNDAHTELVTPAVKTAVTKGLSRGARLAG